MLTSMASKDLSDPEAFPFSALKFLVDKIMNWMSRRLPKPSFTVDK